MTFSSARPSRRDFLVTGAAAAAVATTGLAADVGAQSDTDPGWIDAHVHVWTPDVAKYPISPRFKVADMQPASFTPDQLLDQCKPVGVRRIVLIQMSFYEFDHRYMLHAMRTHPGAFSGVALIDFRDKHLVDRIDELQKQGVRGFRIPTDGKTDRWVDDPGMAKLWQTAAVRGLAICPLINPQDISSVDALCERYPETTVVIDHFARVGVSGTIESVPLANLCQLARHPNTHVKTSAFYALGMKTPPYDDLKPMIRKVYDSFGPERLMWASDCPYQVDAPHTYQASIALVRDRIGFLSDSDKQWMLRGTAEKVFFA
ncbi:4-sulfomuconolactone hydrolase [Rubripirellula lacrimiformis]|uniref:4-sulfomuconolactone hydrolase n=1 Tax=Rubripirellula lacrimiformis TaxID=1930273 RepID=A0A517NCG9_9BACT|nr:amidohydrolase family protein [Rubripirellula lacrimiformis]QDT04806.1 4-sulfomuconolactone hydrolase [Rubripirellula lacrimiformis]